MGKIKFRVWDEASKRIVRAKHISNPNYIPVVPTRKGFELKSKFILMQYTGLKDKNGKEIYEGDIVKHDNEKNYEVKFGYFEESVNGGEYSNQCYGWYIGKAEEFEDYNQIHNPIYVKVIGNIYENPGLLEASK